MKDQEHYNPYKIGNPFYGRNPNDVWKELLSKAVPADKIVAMKQIEETIKARKAQTKK